MRRPAMAAGLSLAAALSLVPGCAAAPGHPAPGPLSPAGTGTDLDAPPAVLHAARARVSLHTTGFLYPAPRAGEPWNYGVLDEELRPLAQRVPGGFRVALPFGCPARGDIARTVFVSDDLASAELEWPAVRLPSFQPVDAALPTEGFLHLGAAATPDVPADSIGYWRATPADYPVEQHLAGDSLGPGPGGVFVYDGHHVTVDLPATRAWHWRPEDSLFRLDARWDGDVLWIRDPPGDFRPFARFRDRRFEAGTTVEGVVLPMRRVDRAEDRAIEPRYLRPRPPFDYAIHTASLARRCDAEGRCASVFGAENRHLCEWWDAHPRR